jgi:broad specificity phosphatase PhoE
VGTLDGYADAALTELGLEQARAAAVYLAGLALDRVRLISSPLRRAAHTAEQIGRELRVEARLDGRLLAGEGRPGQSPEIAGSDVAEAIEAAWDGWEGVLIAVSHRFPIRAYLQRLYGAQTAQTLVDALGNGDALEIVFHGDGDATREAVHHRLERASR